MDIWKDEVFIIRSIKIIIYYIIWKIIFLIPEEDFSDTMMMLKDEEKFGIAIKI